MRISACLLAAIAALAPRAARAEEDRSSVDEASLAAGPGGASARSQAKDWMILPEGVFTLGGGLTFLTADGGALGDEEVKFTDVVLLGFDARYSLGGRAEILGGLSLLPKQPSFTDELIWQGGNLGLRVGFGERYAAWAAASGGPLLDDAGFWGSADLGVQARKSVHETLVFQGALGGAATSLFFDQDTEEAFWFSEVLASGEVVFREPSGNVALWLGTEFRFPVFENPDESSPDPASGQFLDSQTRVNVHVGFVLAYIENWDIFGRFVVVDRGDLVDPATTLPILASGFDQNHIVFGLARRFEADPDERGPKMILAR